MVGTIALAVANLLGSGFHPTLADASGWETSQLPAGIVSSVMTYQSVAKGKRPVANKKPKATQEAGKRPTHCSSCKVKILERWKNFCGNCGQKIVLVSGDPYGENLKPVTEGNITRGYGLNWEPCWNQDGTKVAFTSNRYGNPEICVMNANGTKVTRMTKNVHWDGKPTYGPGELLVYWSDRNGSRELHAWLPSEKKEIAFTEDTSPEFDPAFRFDYQFLAYCSFRNGDYQIVVMDIEGQKDAVITQGQGMNMHPSFCPDGDHVIFSSNRTGNFEIFLMKKDGSEVEQISNNPASDVQPSFHPNGGHIVFVSNRDGMNQLYSFNLDTRDVTQLTNDASRKSAPMWSPKGDKIVYTAEKDGMLDVHIMSVRLP